MRLMMIPDTYRRARATGLPREAPAAPTASRAWLLPWLLALLAVGRPGDVAAAPETTPQAKAAAVLQKHCIACHGPAKSKGKLRLDQLDPDLVDGKDADRWREVLDRLNVGDMPPEK